ncbi:MAG: hypothetical protein ABI927_05220 [Gaiellaceae bacterium]
MSSVLELAADLELRDAAVAAEIGRVSRLADDAKAIGAGAEAIGALLDGLPAECVGADRSEADARAGCSTAEAELATAEALVARREAAGRTGQDLASARRDLIRAQEAAHDAAARLRRAALRQAVLADSERAARAKLPELVAQARSVAGELADVPRVSSSGRVKPETTLAGLVGWAVRVQTALLVVRGQLDVECDRLVREANELGSLVLGEQLGGSSVELVGKRVRAVLAG